MVTSSTGAGPKSPLNKTKELSTTVTVSAALLTLPMVPSIKDENPRSPYSFVLVFLVLICTIGSSFQFGFATGFVNNTVSYVRHFAALHFEENEVVVAQEIVASVKTKDSAKMSVSAGSVEESKISPVELEQAEGTYGR